MVKEALLSVEKADVVATYNPHAEKKTALERARLSAGLGGVVFFRKLGDEDGILI